MSATIESTEESTSGRDGDLLEICVSSNSKRGDLCSPDWNDRWEDFRVDSFVEATVPVARGYLFQGVFRLTSVLVPMDD